MTTTATMTDLKERFAQLVSTHSRLISKVCWMYADDGGHFEDLYQEIMANMWQGLPAFRGDSAAATWIYRLAINTCITFHRRHHRHERAQIPLEEQLQMYGPDDEERRRNLAEMYGLIRRLDAVDKAVIMMWLDEMSYDEIARVTGMGRNTVATRLRRVKQKLIEMSNR